MCAGVRYQPLGMVNTASSRKDVIEYCQRNEDETEPCVGVDDERDRSQNRQRAGQELVPLEGQPVVDLQKTRPSV